MYKRQGIQLANLYGFTTQNPAYYEICSNEATTKQRKLEIDGRKLIVYKPVVNITCLLYTSIIYCKKI